MTARLISIGLTLAIGVMAARVRADEPPAADPPQAKPRLEVEVRGELGSTVGKRDPSGASQVIRGERLRTPGATAGDVLAEVPGVQVARTGSAADLATASIRGATSAETPVYLAGVRLNDDVTGTADLSLVPLWMIQRVEVYRSGAPADADRLGIGGAIFFEPRLPRGPQLGAGAGVGSFGERAAWLAGSVGGERGGAMIAVQAQRADNDYPYLDDRGTTFEPRDDLVRRRPNADHSLYDVWSIGRLRVGDGSITMIANSLSREQGVTGLSVVPARAARARVQRWLGAVTSTLPCAARDRCRIELVTSAVLTSNVLRDPQRELDLLATEIVTVGARVGEQARLRYRVGDAVTLGLGASQEIERIAIDAQSLARTRARRATTRVSGSVVAALTRALELNGLVALDYNATSAASGTPAATTIDDGSILQPTARAGARLRVVEGVEILANGGRYARVPSLGELYGTSAVVHGNPDLTPERGYVVDLGARLGRSSRGLDLFAQVFGFARFASDLVAFRASSLGVIRPYNVARARVLGLELSAGARLLDHVRTDLSLTALDPRDVTPGRALGNDLLPFRARLVTALHLEVFGGPLPVIALDRASLGARLVHRASRAADPAGLIVLPAQAPLDLDVALFFARERLAVRLTLADVLDAPLYDTVGLPLPRRSFHGSTEVWW